MICENFNATNAPAGREGKAGYELNFHFLFTCFKSHRKGSKGSIFIRIQSSEKYCHLKAKKKKKE